MLTSISKILPIAVLLANLATNTIAFPTDKVSDYISKRLDGDGDTTMDDVDDQLPPPVSGPSYADWMKHLYDMGGKVRRSEGDSLKQRDDLSRYKTTVSEEEIQDWLIASHGGYFRDIGT